MPIIATGGKRTGRRLWSIRGSECILHPMDLTVRPIEESEFDTFHAKMARGFGGDPDPKDDPSFFREIIEVRSDRRRVRRRRDA